jgi:hypothetical protein
MKNIVIIIALCLFINTTKAQKIIEKHIDLSKKESVDLNIQITDSITIHTWDKNEVFAKASININENKDNDNYLASFDDSGNKVLISANFKSDDSGKNNCYHDNIIWDIYISENTAFSVKTINGNIVIVGKTSEIKAYTISGFIDLSVSSDKRADLIFSTISGTVYSNHEFVSDNTNRSYHSKIYDRMNGGGTPINLETISGDIFFRTLK